ncbi:hypothetical protein GCM10022291_32810 [Postechiella marina]|uniref:Uncharacterized protein n=2 Tax=Postechiella marina TaxID=943941 RepID=A0ABP8CH23_9FLAO
MQAKLVREYLNLNEMKKIILLFAVLYGSIIYSQSLNDIVRFKTMNLNQIEETLILADWKFVSSESKKANTKPKNVWEFEPETYTSRTYEYIGYAGDKTLFTVIDYADKNSNEIKIRSENRLVYKNVLQDILSSNFELTDKKCPYISAYLGDFKIGEKVIMESNGKVYQKGNNNIHIIINRYAIITGKNNGKFSYDENAMIDEFKIIVE